MSLGQLQVGVGWIPAQPYLEHKLKRIPTHLQEWFGTFEDSGKPWKVFGIRPDYNDATGRN